MYYFAYGFYLNKKIMLESCPESKPMVRDSLPNYKLIITGWSRLWRGGMVSIRSFRGEKVPGVVYEISDRDLNRLDKYRGYPRDYNRLNVTVFDEDGESIKAVTYIKTGQSEEAQPSREYLAIIQQGYRDWVIV
ncbi:MAG: gamma-glutamylcyclotransferase [Dehalococcoidales bacterium]|nr:gamma-glutamylcyclotransferase [Dehalococcoidales bacterium]